jgi:hypothetical protein
LILLIIHYLFSIDGEKKYDPTVGWDGTYGVSGSISPDGTYTWKIDVKIPDYDERRTFTGYVNLLR